MICSIRFESVVSIAVLSISFFHVTDWNKCISAFTNTFVNNLQRTVTIKDDEDVKCRVYPSSFQDSERIIFSLDVERFLRA